MAARNVRFVQFATKSLTDGTVPKNRKPKFELGLSIVDLNNVPLVAGTAAVKWHLPSSAAAEHRGKTHSAPIKDHKVSWEYRREFPLRMVIDKTGMLQDLEIHLQVIQEYSSGAKADRLELGVVRLNLAEYVDVDDEEAEDGIKRRYLMQDSKINSTLRISIRMRQIEGDRNFLCPPLKSAAMFGGIAGIMNAAESTELSGSHEDLPPSLPTQKSRDFGEMQDIYRQSLAASWSSYMNELPADQCIEDIFAGGDGWGQGLDSASIGSIPPIPGTRSQTGSHGRLYGPLAKYLDHSHIRRSSKDLRRFGRSASAGNQSTASGDTSTSQSSGSEEARKVDRKLREINELELNDDLSSWRISGTAEKLNKLGVAKQAGKVV